MGQPINRIIYLWAVALCAGCAPYSPWKLQSIDTGDIAHNTARLTHYEPSHYTDLRYEIYTDSEGAIESYLSLMRFAFTPLPGTSLIELEVQCGHLPPLTEIVPLKAGKGRLRLPDFLTQKVVQALLDGQTVTLRIDKSEEVLEPERFSKFFDRLTSSAAFLHNPFQGPL